MPDAPSEGGRNYLTNISSNWQNKYVYTNGAGTNSFFQMSSTTRISPKNFIAVEAGKQYTISLKELAYMDYYFKVTMSTVAAYGVANSMLNRDEWIYSDSYTFTAPENCNYIMISVCCDSGVTPEDLNSKFNIKLEESNVATPYSAAPEDIGWSITTLVPTQANRYLWKFEYIYYSDDSVEVTQPVNLSIAGADADTTGVTAAIEQANQDIAGLTTAKNNLQSAVDSLNNKATSLQSDLATVSDSLASSKQELQSSISAVDNKADTVQSNINKAKQDLLTSISNVQSGLTSTTNRTKAVEYDLANTKTTLSATTTTANSASQKAATLESGLNGLTAKFENLKIGSRNYFKDSKSRKYYIDSKETQDVRTYIDEEFWQNDTRFTKNYVRMSFDIAFNPALPTDFTTNVYFSASPLYNCGGITFKGGTTALQHFDLKFDLSGAGNSYKTDNVFIRLNNTLPLNTAVSLENFNLYLSAVVEDYNQNEADIESKVADYKQTADQNYASLQSTVQNLDGTVQQNKTVADQTAAGFKTRIESLETYQSGETTRANQYFESAKTETARQLTAERTAIAKDYVAKSTYTSDVTGIRNDLTATTTTANTTKTNLANYQASNDKAVANLQSNLQTANGNVSSLQTKVEAVPGQITSAVSAVEGKIPTSLDSLNLMTGTRDWSTKANKWHMGEGWSTEGEEYQGLKVHSTQKGWNGSHQNIFVKSGDVVTFSFFAKATNTLSRIIVFSRWEGSSVYQAPLAGVKESDEEITVTNEWKRYSKTVHITSDGTLQFRTEYNGATIPDGNTFYVAGLKVAKSALDTGYSENPTDAASDITKLNTTLTQTADGLKQLSTQVTSQGSTITSHTNSINSLTTGLQAKVSQTEFNTLSGRVTTAENNITAKANELSSKITSVEGKIPTSIGGRNLWIQSKTTGGFVEETLPDNHITGQKKCYRITNNAEIKFNIEPDFSPRLYRTVTFSAWVKYENVAQGSNGWNVFNCFKHTLYRKNSSTGATSTADYLTLAGFTGTSDWKYVTYTYDYAANKSYDQLKTIIIFNLESVKSGTAWVTGVKIEVGSIPSDYSPAPDDTESDINAISSQIKQTADGMTLLATKTELNTAKSDLQSSISTATSKADNAQTTANSNAQTISTHTTQISALNTGLSAKVSKSDFDSLSGRVTTAESNLTATANELSSKITSVEGKIPTSIGGANLFKRSRDFSGKDWVNKDSGIYAEDYQGVKIFKKQTSCGGVSQYFEVKTGEEYVFSAYVKSSAKTDRITFYLVHISKQPQASGVVSFNSANSQDPVTFDLTDEYQRIAIKIKITKDGWIMPRLERYNSDAYLFFGGYKLERGNIPTDYSPAPDDTESDINAVSSQIKQTADAITASVSSVQATASNAQSTANTAVSKADAAQAGINTLDSTTVKTATLNLDNNGFVTKVGKTVNGNTFATMIAQNESDVQIIAKKMKVSGDMIVNGAITAEKLNVSNLSAVNSNLGKIEGGSLLLQKNKTASSSIDSWGTFNRPAHKQGLYMDNSGLASSGAIQRKNGGETTPTDMPLAVLQSGELIFLVVDYNDNLENVLHYGLSDTDFGFIRFEIDSELKRRLTMTSSGYLNFQASNYTDWIPLSQQGCEYMIQGRLVVVNYDVTYSQSGTHKIGDIPQEFVKKELMLTAKAWSITPNDKNFQLNADGGLHLLNADANVTYRGTLLFSY